MNFRGIVYESCTRVAKKPKPPGHGINCTGRLKKTFNDHWEWVLENGRYIPEPEESDDEEEESDEEIE